jgi:hypothetical protein
VGAGVPIQIFGKPSRIGVLEHAHDDFRHRRTWMVIYAVLRESWKFA